ncbi:MAG: PilN domain-containing protein [Thermodesulfobacteria bacterium]|nr:PilN domain-containing protein [Thermodesulfobacteriota bacterium]
MDRGFIKLRPDALLEVSVQSQKDALQILKVNVCSLENFKEKKAVIGIPLKEIFLKNIVLPLVSKKELSKVVELQKNYHIPWQTEKTLARVRISNTSRDTILLLLAYQPNGLSQAGALIPLPISLLLWCLHLSLIENGKNHLIAFLDGEEVHIVVTQGTEVVFMRSLKKPVQLGLEMKFSAQAVYLQKERKVLLPDRIIVFSSTEQDLKEVFPESEVKYIKPTEVLIGDYTPENFLTAGIALYNQHKKLVKDWNLIQKEGQWRRALLRGFIYTIPLWFAFLPLYYLGDTTANLRVLRQLENRHRALAPLYRKVVKEEEEVRNLNTFVLNYNDQIHSPQEWLKILKILNDKKPDGVTIETFSGSLSGTILLGGKADSYEKVTQYLKALQKVKSFKELRLLFTQKEEGGSVSFQMSFKIDTSLLSLKGRTNEAEVKA